MKLHTGISALATCLLMASGAIAGPLPSYDYLGTNKAITVSASGFPNSLGVKTSGGADTSVTGGGFTAQISKTGSTPYTATTTVWCVDSQLHFDSNTPLEANITSLANTGWNASEVRYGNLTGNTGGTYNSASNTKFVYDVGLGANDNALNRYRMAAFLVSQYNGFPAGPTDNAPSGGADNDRNDALQRSVWKVMYNNSGSNPYRFWYSELDFSSGAPGGQNWVQTALNFVNTAPNDSFFRNWAVISWDVNNGNVNGYCTPDMQTFLVQVVPEPSFYGLLGLGLTGLFLAARRRKIARD